MTLPSNMNELIALVKQNWMFLFAFILIMILVDYMLILKRKNRIKIEEYEAVEKYHIEHQSRLKEEHKIATIEQFKKWNREWNSVLRLQCFKRKPNYQSRKRRSQHGINRYYQRHI